MIYLVNAAWLTVTVFFWWLLRPLRKPFVLSVVAVICWRIHEIAPHRPAWSWLPDWWITLEYGRLFDGYHLTGGLYGILAVAVGFYAGRRRIWPERLNWRLWAVLAVFALYLGVTANLFYHVNLMYPDFREYDMIFHFWNKN